MVERFIGLLIFAALATTASAQISSYSSLDECAGEDLLVVVDVSDTSTPPAGPGGSNKKLTCADLFDNSLDWNTSGQVSGSAFSTQFVPLAGTSASWDVSQGSYAEITLSANSAVTVQNLPTNASALLRVVNSGAFTLTVNAVEVPVRANGVTYVTVVNVDGTLDLLSSADKISVGDIEATGTADNTTFFRGDGTWATPSGGAPTTAAYWVSSPDGTLSNEVVVDGISALNNALGEAVAPVASPTFTGDPKAPTPSSGDNDTSVATTAFVDGAVAKTVDFTGNTSASRPSTTGFVIWTTDTAGECVPGPTNAQDGDLCLEY